MRLVIAAGREIIGKWLGFSSKFSWEPAEGREGGWDGLLSQMPRAISGARSMRDGIACHGGWPESPGSGIARFFPWIKPTPMPDGLPPTLRTTDELLRAGLVPASQAAALRALEARYAIAIPAAFQSLIEHAADPIGLQTIPHPDEALTGPHELTDPTADAAMSPMPGLVHRYPDRVLIKPLLICPLYCRFCFRREQVGPDGGLLTEAQLEAALHYVRGRPAIREVILTGGDPLMLSARRLSWLLRALDEIPHLEILRIHSRVPVAAPHLVSPALLDALDTAKPLYLAVHANHAREFAPAAAAALRALSRAGLVLLGQSVLLRGVNDSEAALEDLFRAMLRNRVKPYYLHQLDAAPGTARFHVPEAEGLALLGALRGRVTGLALPTYVREQPQGAGKRPVLPSLDLNT
jgi:lysine 2,3-aminomutase